MDGGLQNRKSNFHKTERSIKTYELLRFSKLKRLHKKIEKTKKINYLWLEREQEET